MALKKQTSSRKTTSRSSQPHLTPVRLTVAGKALRSALTACDCRARNAFQQFRSGPLPPSFNVAFNFTIPPKSRLVIELVTASINVPAGEMARLRMLTGIGQAASNLDLVVTPQGIVGDRQNLVATHRIRAYADSLLEFNVNRDNAVTQGDALICVSGYIEPL